MKIIHCICVLFFGIFFAALAPGVNAQAVNLVPNPSLETASGSMPQNWSSGKWGTNTTTFTYLTGGHTGSRSVEVQITKYTSGDAKWYFTPQTVTPGTVYTVSDYYESNIVTHVIVQFQLTNGTYQYTELATAPASSTAWKQYTGTVTAPASAANMTVFHLISAVGWLTTDDYSVTSGTVPTTGSITVTKTAVNGNGTFNFTGSTGISAFSITTSGGTGSNTINNLTPGTYTITEGTLGTGWAQTATTCSSVTVTAGNTATCTVTNTYTAPPTTGSIKVTKTAVNGNGTFNFTGSTGISAFSIATTSGTGTYTVSNLTSGTYTITEGTLVSGWAQTSTTCSSVTVTAGNTATCTVVNTYTQPTPGEIVPNPSLEIANAAGNAPQSWSSSNWGINTPVFTYDTTGHTGSRSVKVQLSSWSSGDAKWMFDAQPIVHDSVYAVSDYYKSNITSRVVAVFNLSDGTQKFAELAQAAASPVNWAHYYAFVATPSNAVSMSISHLIDNIGWLSTDDYSVTLNSASSNAILNPSLEITSGNLPANWNNQKWGTNTTTFEYLASQGHTGTHSVKVTTTAYTDGDSKWYFNPIAVTPGDVYLFSDWYQSNTTTRIVIDFTYADGSDNYFEIRNASPSSNWAQYSDMIWVPVGAKTMTVFHLISSVGWLITDDYSLTKTTPSGFNRPVVSLTFDDGDESIYKNAFPILASDGFKSTAYIISNTLTDTSGAYISSAQLKTMYQAGFEIGSHSVSHPDLTTLTPSELNAELAQSKKDLENVVGTGNVKSFASPYGAYNATVLNAIKTNYQSHRPVDVGYNVQNNFDPYRLKVQNVEATTTPAEYQSWISQAIKDKSWLIIVYHGIVTSNPGDYDTSLADFTTQMNYVKSTGVTVEPLTQAIAEITPQLGQ